LPLGLQLRVAVGGGGELLLRGGGSLRARVAFGLQRQQLLLRGRRGLLQLQRGVPLVGLPPGVGVRQRRPQRGHVLVPLREGKLRHAAQL
jgi:hypothetical protein